MPLTSRRPADHRAVRGVLTFVALAFAAALLPAHPAGATEFNPVPKIDYLAQCYNLHQGLHVSFVLSNEGQGIADFHLIKTDNGVVTTEDFSVGATHATPDYFILENHVPSFSVTSTDGPGASFSYTFGAVDCEADPSGSIAMVCPTVPGDSAVIQYTWFNPSVYDALFDFTVPGGSSFSHTSGSMGSASTETRDVAEGSAAVATISADGVQIASLDTVVDCVAEVTTTTTVPVTTTTSPPTTSSTVTTTSTTLPAVVSAGTVTPPPPAAPAPTVLARTGSTTGPLAVLGFTLVGLGIAAIRASRRRLIPCPA